MTDSYLVGRAYRHGRSIAYLLKKEGAKLHEGEPLAKRIAALRRRLALRTRMKMLSPFPYQRRRAIYDYYRNRGISDQFTINVSGDRPPE